MESKNMFSSERFKLIADYLKEHNRATVDELGKVLYVSPATVRRDLAEMSKLGLIQRTHGGAVFLDASNEVNIFVRIEKNANDKEKTVSIAMDKIPEFNSAFIDNSSTCLALAERMDFAYKTVITNGLQIAVKLSNKSGVNVIFLGGNIQYNSYSTDGSLTTEMMEKFHVDVFFSSCAGVRLDGSYETTMECMQIKRSAFKRADRRYLLIDRNKFDSSFVYRVETLDNYDAIFTNANDQTIDPYLAKGFRMINK